MENSGGQDVHLQVTHLKRLSEAYSSDATIFEPTSALEQGNSSNAYSTSSASQLQMAAPEKQLTLFALRVAIFEKIASGLGALSFVWATVVLLGGYAIVLDKADFWFITIILVIEGTRIFSRSHELEWQHQSTWLSNHGGGSLRALRSSSRSLLSMIKGGFRPVRKPSQRVGRAQGSAAEINPLELQRKPTRRWSLAEVSIVPYGRLFFVSRNVSRILYWLQIISALACVALSLFKLIEHDYEKVAEGERRNRNYALSIFYSLALCEATMFLMEKLYWEWKVIGCRLFEQVMEESDLGPTGMVCIKRFLYDAYSRSINGSIFDGLKMDMVTYSMEMLDSVSPDEQLIGARALYQLAMSPKFSDDTLLKIGTNITVIERLVEMLNWKGQPDEEIRRSAAEILSKLSGKKQNSLRVVGIPGAMESISSLLQTSRISSVYADEIGEKTVPVGEENNGIWTFNHLGLQILKKLSRDQENCGKIGNTRGLLPKIIDFTFAGERLLKDESASSSQVMSVKRSLQIVKNLASSTGETGRVLRKEISEIVFSISNIRAILKHGENHPILQRLGIEILTSLSLEEEATERIGETGGVLKELFNIFFKNAETSCQSIVRTAAGEALAMLALGSKCNCHRILNQKVLDRLIKALEDPLLSVNAGRILRNLCAYSGEECFDKLIGVTAAAPVVLKTIVTDEHKLQEVMVGLAAEAFQFMSSRESRNIYEEAGVGEAELADTLIQIFKRHENPSIKFPGIRRYAIELAIWLMRDNSENRRTFRELGLAQHLENLLETTAEFESFNVFSGTVGLYRHRNTMSSLVETALVLVH